jgi:hypothetical protein
MSNRYVVAFENFKEAQKRVSAEKDPAMFSLISGLMSLAEHVGADFDDLRKVLAESRQPVAIAPRATKKAKKVAATRSVTKGAKAKKPASPKKPNKAAKSSWRTR